ncbi:hypothetical protein A3J90_08795 [candidate division WOR-1 bacterium RIFOXYC2_FULL_37_10]|uniref:Methyltransferase domain-containing protein n=1 Tax=candidate division WOR-1 bacterium RIFOXYB2_FULL_37_13 TaxID=1802579 RepID=A0A1F4SNL0_UNCSA|nr:MAG: hypothetical protein A2310_07075 [candidate division WOR-1 bacterium RIFOXYB2_FULL_37_13]OGC33070.1 MAG: hypothetical protein A3J90_08795 [candidate division WOR-1 bacterium RIFOXYC2_FULL_37_10]
MNKGLSIGVPAKVFASQITYCGRLREIHNFISDLAFQYLFEYMSRGIYDRVIIADVGIGAGNQAPLERGVTTRELASRLLGSRIEVLGIDLDLQPLFEAIEMNLKLPDEYPPFVLPNLRYFEKDVVRGPFLEQKSVDIIFCTNAIKNISDPSSKNMMFRNIFRALKAGGAFVYNTGVSRHLVDYLYFKKPESDPKEFIDFDFLLRASKPFYEHFCKPF